MKRLRFLLAICLSVGSTAHDVVGSNEGRDGAALTLTMRKQVETSPESGRYHTLREQVQWRPAETAVIVCDMWNLHHCKNATDRVAEMAPRMNEVLKALRKQGCQIIHCPSGVLGFYEGHTGRQLAQSAPPVETKVPLEQWCHLDPEHEGKLPIDDSDGGCDTEPGEQKKWRETLIARGHKPGSPWTRQIETLEIHEGDAITDNAEAFYLMKQKGITNVIVMGVHTNMCVLGRPFSIRQMVRQGQNVVLMRDMTDTMYNPAKAPFVSHFTGTDLVVEHIEKHWCSTITSDQIIGGSPFRFAKDERPHLAIVIAEDEYQTWETLPKFASEHLASDYRISYVFGGDEDIHVLPGIEVLDEADLALFSVRRRTPPNAQLKVIRRFVASGKPLAAIRTSSHAFALRGAPPAEGRAAWPEFDKEVLGCHYAGHHGNKGESAPATYVWKAEGAAQHPILAGIPDGEFRVPSWLYKSLPLAEGTATLLMGRVGDRQPHEPVAWVNQTSAGGAVFYTSLGHPDEFEMPAFQRLLTNAIGWAAKTGGEVAAEEESAANSWPFPYPREKIAKYDAHWTNQAPQIDGHLDESCWLRVPQSPRFADLITGETAKFDTRAAVLWDREYLYIGFWIEEPDVQGNFLRRDSPIYRENDVEVFIAGRDAYYEFEINARNTIYEVFFIWRDAFESGGFASAPEFAKGRRFNGVGFRNHPRGLRQGFFDWDFPGIQTAVQIDGTLNDSSDQDRGWTVELAFPWSGMEWLAKSDGRSLPPQAGDVWRIDFSRFEKLPRRPGRRRTAGWAWSPHGVWDSHIPELFPQVRFVREPVQELPERSK